MDVTWTDGIVGGAVTPFTEHDTVDWESMRNHLEQLAGGGLSAVLVNASMAEGSHLTERERDDVLAFALDAVGSQVPVITTVYGRNTVEAAEEAKRAAAAGARGLLVFPHPAFGGQPLDPALPVDYFRALWSAAELPMIVFRTPSSLGPTFDLEALRRLAEVPGVTAIKDSTGDLDFYRGEAAEFLAPDSPVKVLADFDPLILDFLRAGAHGATVISAVIDPERYAKLFDNRNSAMADELYRQLAHFARAIYEPPFRDFRARLKEALRLDGVIATSHVRRPLLPLSEPERQRVAQALHASRGVE